MKKHGEALANIGQVESVVLPPHLRAETRLAYQTTDAEQRWPGPMTWEEAHGTDELYGRSLDIAEFVRDGERIPGFSINREREIKTFWPGSHGFVRGAYARNGKLAAILASLASGRGVRATARHCGVAKATVARLRLMLIATKGEFFCECGKPTTHRGWCRVRYAASPKRQAVIERMHRAAASRAERVA